MQVVKRRVVVTGIGVISPNGIGKKNAWEGFSGGKSGVRLVDGFDVSAFNTKIAAEVKDFDPFDFIDKKKAKNIGRGSQFAIAAAKMALEDAQLSGEKIDSAESLKSQLMRAKEKGVGEVVDKINQEEEVRKQGPRIQT